jgi:hypothetical protein
MKKKNEIVPSCKGLAVLPKVSDVFSEYDTRGIYSWDRLATVGKNNLGYFLSRLRGSEKGHTNEIQKLQERKNLFLEAMKEPSGIPADYFKRLAKENEIGKRPGGWGDDPEPLTPESESREAGTTTFNMCGWCKHTGGGSCRYQYHITTTCELLSALPGQVAGEKLEDYVSQRQTIHQYRELRFNTPCLLGLLTKEQCEENIKSIEHNIEIEKIEREKVREAIKKVQEFEAAAKSDKPWLVCNRPSEYMNVGDPLMIYMAGWDNKTVEGDWVEAIGVYGYRHHDSCMSYQTMFPIHSNYSYLEGRGGGAGMGRPEALLRSEFDYLHSIMSRNGFGHALTLVENGGVGSEDTTFVDIWLNSIGSDLKGFDKKKFIQSLMNPNLAKPPKSWIPPTTEITVKTVKDAEHVLNMLDADLHKTEKDIRSWANMQLRCVHPDRFANATDEVKQYAARQTKAIYAARELLINRLKSKNN